MPSRKKKSSVTKTKKKTTGKKARVTAKAKPSVKSKLKTVKRAPAKPKSVTVAKTKSKKEKAKVVTQPLPKTAEKNPSAPPSETQQPKIGENAAESQRLGFGALLEEAKNKGYLVHEDLINLLPNDYADPSQMEGIIGRLTEMGIKVFEIPPDADSLLLEEDTQSDDDEINEDVAEVLATETRTTDPVRMYMREMGSVELLTREGEIVIAKHIEEGIRQVMGAVVQYPELIEKFIKEYDTIVATEGRLSDLLIGFFDEEESTASPVAPEARDKEAETSDEDDGGEGGSDEFGESGPDPLITQQHMEELKKLYGRYQNAIKRYGKKAPATLKHHKALAELFSTFKRSIKKFNRLTGQLRRMLRAARAQERLIMSYCVVKAKTPRKKFIASFPHNETNMKWLEQYKNSTPHPAHRLSPSSPSPYRAPRPLSPRPAPHNLH
ncbi:RNA polymerase sigma factor region1.1 domain-containing protein, partial [Coxiella burnetii]